MEEEKQQEIQMVKKFAGDLKQGYKIGPKLFQIGIK